MSKKGTSIDKVNAKLQDHVDKGYIEMIDILLIVILLYRHSARYYSGECHSAASHVSLCH